MSEQERTRFRSFAERYLIERAKTFHTEEELEDGWKAIEDAKKLYVMVESAGLQMFPFVPETDLKQSAMQAKTPSSMGQSIPPSSWFKP